MSDSDAARRAGGEVPVRAAQGGGDAFSELDLLRAHRLYQKVMRYPTVLDEIRAVFRAALQDAGVLVKEELEARARLAAATDGVPEDPETLRDYRDALTDVYFSRHFAEGQVEEYINYARKKESFRKLNRILNTEGVTSAKIKQALRDFCSIPQGEMILPATEVMGVRVALISHFISSQLPFIGIAKPHITTRDVDELVDHSYWDRRRPGKIGGKAAGMFLAHRIVLPRFGKRDPDMEKYVRIPESYYFNSGIFSDFVDYNKLDRLYTQKYKTREEIEREYLHIEEVFRHAQFPPDVLGDFRDFLQRVGEHPLILRSSTLLEDNFGFAFSGKYDSVFVANQGDLDTRLAEFTWGLKRVHMSTYGPAPILYRLNHNLLDFDERMAVLVQKVVGRRHGDYFFPFASGVAYSYNVHRWSPRIRKEDGLVRLVLGLGTRAVDRVAADYPRMIPLTEPLLRPEIGAEQIAKYSQKLVDVIDLSSDKVQGVLLPDLLRKTDHPDMAEAVSLDQEGHLTPPLFRGQPIDPACACITFENLLRRSPFVPLIRKVLRMLHEAYRAPVDVEFAWEGGLLYLLQCRPYGVKEYRGKITLPTDVPPEQILFTTSHSGSNYARHDIRYAVYVDPKAYGRLPSRERKLEVGRAVSQVNRMLEGKRYALFGPGRWGSNDIHLGVRVGYEDINHAAVLGEVAFSEGGSTPEVSYGTHFFNDLVEAEIVPIAIYPDEPGAVFREDLLVSGRNLLPELAPALHDLAEVVHVVDLPARYNGCTLQVLLDEEEGRGMGFLAPPLHPEGTYSRTPG
ncbi:MAG: hypothetical protein HY900_17820 [Deltaproteobacteria bacterium]|nr:hypothetical protein [Deltaproteobacteria bacterium]